jgi:fucose 4-O-acetylase-like acetyltransferase
MKGMAIVLVVLGHAIQKNTVNYQSNYLFCFIYSFHMPLFFSVSGYLMYLTLANNRFNWIKNKAVYLVIPHIVFDVLYYFASSTGLTVYDNVTVTFSFFRWLKESLFVNSGEWFLWVLFSCFVILVLFKWVEERFPPVLFWGFVALFTILLLLIPEINKDYLRIYEIQWYFLFALSGYLVAKYRQFIKRYSALIVIGALDFPVLMSLGNWNRGDLFFPSHLFSSYLTFHLTSFYFSRFLQGIEGICLVLLIALALSKFPRLSTPIVWLGRLTMGVYLFHMFFSGLHVGSAYLAIISSFVFSLSLGIALTLICSKIPLLGKTWLKSNLRAQH